MTVSIIWRGLDLKVAGEFDAAEPEVGVMSATFIIEGIWCEGQRQYAVECLEDAMIEIEEACIKQIEDDREEARCDAMMNRW